MKKCLHWCYFWHFAILKFWTHHLSGSTSWNGINVFLLFSSNECNGEYDKIYWWYNISINSQIWWKVSPTLIFSLKMSHSNKSAMDFLEPSDLWNLQLEYRRSLSDFIFLSLLFLCFETYIFFGLKKMDRWVSQFLPMIQKFEFPLNSRKQWLLFLENLVAYYKKIIEFLVVSWIGGRNPIRVWLKVHSFPS